MSTVESRESENTESSTTQPPTPPPPSDSWYHLTKEVAWNSSNDMIKGYKITREQFQEFRTRLSRLFVIYGLDKAEGDDFEAWELHGYHVVEKLHGEFSWLHDETILLEWRTNTLREYVRYRCWDMRNLTGMAQPVSRKTSIGIEEDCE